MDTLIVDLKYAGRSIVTAPKFTAVVVVTLALRIGATTAVFSVLNGVVLKPLPYDQAEQLVRVYSSLYGVLSYSVSRRTHEMGIRLALGATPRSVRSMIVRDGGRLALAGIVLGCAGAFVTTRFLRSLLYEVSTTEPLVFAAAAGMLALVAVLASWLPAHAATKVDPLEAVRN